MFKVELKEGMQVVTSDGRELGQINRFILDPATNEVSHIVVEKGWLLPEDKVLPFEHVNTETDDQLVLSDQIRDFDDLPAFEERYYVRTPDRDPQAPRTAGAPVYPTAPAYYWYPPHGYVGFPAYGLGTYGWPLTQKVQNIPSDNVPLKEGTNVMSSDDKHVGDVERLLVESGSRKATHFVVSQGLLFKDRKLVPANWIRTVTDEKVHLTVDSEVLEGLPSYKE